MALNATTDFIFILFCSSNQQSQAVAIYNELDSKLGYKAPTTVTAHELRTTDKIKTHTCTHDRPTETHTLIRERTERKTKTHKVVKYMLSSKSHKVIMGHQTAETVKNRLAQQIV